MGNRQPVARPQPQAYMKTSQDMRSTSTGFHLLEIHTATAVKAGTTVLVLLAVAVRCFLLWRRMVRRAAAREAWKLQEMNTRSSL